SPMSIPSLSSSPWIRCSPKLVVAAHPTNQLASLDRYAGAPATTLTGFPPPEETEALSVPTDDPLRFDLDQCKAPAPPSGAFGFGRVRRLLGTPVLQGKHAD